MIPTILFWFSAGLIFHSYVLYPFIMNRLAKRKNSNNRIYTKDEEFPAVSILLAVFNEEKVIREKLESLNQLIYPKDRLEILICSDASTDETDRLIRSAQVNLNIHLDRKSVV